MSVMPEPTQPTTVDLLETAIENIKAKHWPQRWDDKTRKKVVSLLEDVHANGYGRGCAVHNKEEIPPFDRYYSEQVMEMLEEILFEDGLFFNEHLFTSKERDV